MKKSDVLEYFGGSPRRVAEFLGISVQAVHACPKIVPDSSAYKLQVLTNGELKVK
jgi:hypothetical protein